LVDLYQEEDLFGDRKEFISLDWDQVSIFCQAFIFAMFESEFAMRTLMMLG
jgi:hypothetical protein